MTLSAAAAANWTCARLPTQHGFHAGSSKTRAWPRRSAPWSWAPAERCATCELGGRLDYDVVGSAQFMHFHQKVVGPLLVLGAGEAGRAGGVLLAHRVNFVGVHGAGPWAEASFHRLRAAHRRNSTSAAGAIALACSAFPPRPARQQGLTPFPIFVASAIARGAILIRLKALIPPSLPVFLARRRTYHRVAEPTAVIPKAERAFTKKPLSL